MVGTTNLTQGPIRQQLISLAVPMLMGNILQQLYNTIDAVVVGAYVGDSAFASVGVAGSVMNLFLFLISGSCSGTGAFLSQHHGAGDGKAFRKSFFLAACFGTLFTLLLTLTSLGLLSPLLRLLQTPADVIPYATDYLRTIFLGFFSAFIYHLGAAVLRAVGKTRAALVFLMLSMVLNIVLDITFIAKFSWGVTGAALATVISQATAAILCMGYLLIFFPHLVFHREDMGLDKKLLKRIFHFSSTAALHMCNLYIGKLLVQGTVNGLGTDAISAYTAATRIEGFANSFGDSGASSLSIFTGQNTGAKNKKRIRSGFITGEKLLAAFGIFMSALMFLAAVPTLKFVLPEGSESSLAPAVGYLRLISCFYLFNFLGSGLSGYFQGRGHVNIPVIGATGHITIRVILSFLLASKMGLPAVALASGLGWMFVVTFWSFLYRRDQKALAEDKPFFLFRKK